MANYEGLPWSKDVSRALYSIIEGGGEEESVRQVVNLCAIDDGAFLRVSRELFCFLCSPDTQKPFEKKLSLILRAQANLFKAVAEARPDGEKRFCLIGAIMHRRNGEAYMKNPEHPVLLYIRLCELHSSHREVYHEKAFFYSVSALCNLLKENPKLVEIYTIPSEELHLQNQDRTFVLVALAYCKDSNYEYDFKIRMYMLYSRVDEPALELFKRLNSPSIKKLVDEETVTMIIFYILKMGGPSYFGNHNLKDFIVYGDLSPLISADNETDTVQVLFNLALNYSQVTFRDDYTFLKKYVRNRAQYKSDRGVTSISIETILRSQSWWKSIKNEDCEKEAFKKKDKKSFFKYALKSIIPKLYKAASEKRFLIIQLLKCLEERLPDSLPALILVDFLEFDFGGEYMRLPIASTMVKRSDDTLYMKRHSYATATFRTAETILFDYKTTHKKEEKKLHSS